ncbi:hypothetical protein F4778DRAFT_749856 [Xylariomycetidae sp. FL2044]|nr:hypothetical protein F4778DRAFT_749856 [Xylariomycetidae sp. FL2044]
MMGGTTRTRTTVLSLSLSLSRLAPPVSQSLVFFLEKNKERKRKPDRFLPTNLDPAVGGWLRRHVLMVIRIGKSKEKKERKVLLETIISSDGNRSLLLLLSNVLDHYCI